MVFLLLIAGHETTVNLIGNGMLALLQNPHQMERLRGDPSLIKSAVEELLRYTSPVFMTSERYALDNATMHDVTIPRGEMILGVIGSANRDETVFDNPNELNLAREPNKHISFGQGIHFCLGAPLARMESQIAINTLLKRIPNLQLKIDPDIVALATEYVLERAAHFTGKVLRQESGMIFIMWSVSPGFADPFHFRRMKKSENADDATSNNPANFNRTVRECALASLRSAYWADRNRRSCSRLHTARSGRAESHVV